MRLVPASTSVLVPRAALAAFTLATSLLASSARADDGGVPGVLTWHTPNATLAGSACSGGVDGFVLNNGDDLSMVFDNLGVALGHGSPATGQGICSVSVPVDVPAALFPAVVDQTYDYGVRRTSGGTGSLTAAVHFLGITVATNPLLLNDADGGAPGQGNHLLATREDHFDHLSPAFPRWCARTRPTSGTFQIDFRASAQIATPNDSITMFVDGLGLRYDVHTTWQACGS